MTRYKVKLITSHVIYISFNWNLLLYNLPVINKTNKKINSEKEELGGNVRLRERQL